jgi:hypothetical protein
MFKEHDCVVLNSELPGEGCCRAMSERLSTSMAKPPRTRWSSRRSPEGRSPSRLCCRRSAALLATVISAMCARCMLNSPSPFYINDATSGEHRGIYAAGSLQYFDAAA